MVLDEVDDDRKKTMTMEQQTFFLDSYVVFKRRVGVFIFRVLKVRLDCLSLSLFFFFVVVRDLSKSVLCGLQHS